MGEMKRYKPSADYTDGCVEAFCTEDNGGNYVLLADYDTLMSEAVRFAEVVSVFKARHPPAAVKQAVAFLASPAVAEWRTRQEKENQS